MFALDGIAILRAIVLTLLMFRLWRRSKRIKELERELERYREQTERPHTVESGSRGRSQHATDSRVEP